MDTQKMAYMWINMHWNQRIGYAFAIMIVALITIVFSSVVLTYINQRSIPLDGWAIWLSVIMIAMFPERYLAPTIRNKLLRTLIVFAIMVMVACVGFEMQSNQTDFWGFPNRFSFIAFAVPCVLIYLYSGFRVQEVKSTQQAAKEKRQGSVSTPKRRRRSQT